ncbi:MAG: hypothetical protein C0487_02065 [Leptothrix sp. (in: Bacteria)]|nr:hypothetical protein [Leptothrix sp. (in: b-proteobacteria)]
MLKDAFKRWNRRRLDNRRLKLSGVQASPIDAKKLSVALGLSVTQLGVRHLMVASRQANAPGKLPGSPDGRSALLAAVAALPGDIHTSILMDEGQTLQTAAQAASMQGASHLIWVGQDHIVERHAIHQLLLVSAASGHQALVDASRFPEDWPKPLDPNTLTTPWVSSRCLLIPSKALALFQDAAKIPIEQPAADMRLADLARAQGLALLSCPTALVTEPIHSPQAANQGATVSVVIRHHDSKRLSELQRCLFSIACSTYPHIEALVVCQSFAKGDLGPIQAYADQLMGLRDIDIRILNPELPQGIDHRSALLNTGIAAATGRYLAFLDYDDCIRPDAYDKLIQACQASGSRIAFGDILVKKVAIVGPAIITRATSRNWGNRNIFDLLHDNCCPIHSYVIDRNNVPDTTLRFDEALSKYEDYDFLVKICSQYRSDFSLIGEVVGDYYIKEDGSNSVITSSSFSAAAKEAWLASKQTVHNRRDDTPLGPDALAQVNQALIEAKLPPLAAGATVHHLNRRSEPLRKFKSLK